MPRFYETTLSITNLHNLSISTHVNRSRIQCRSTSVNVAMTLSEGISFKNSSANCLYFCSLLHDNSNQAKPIIGSIFFINSSFLRFL